MFALANAQKEKLYDFEGQTSSVNGSRSNADNHIMVYNTDQRMVSPTNESTAAGKPIQK